MIFFSSLNGYAQKLQYVQGELLIQVNEGIGLDAIQRSYRNQYNFNFLKIISQPFDIWKLEFDHTEVNEMAFLRKLQDDSRIKYAQFNHLIEERVIPNDPQFAFQWQYIQDLSPGAFENMDLDAEQAWDITTGGLTATGDTIVACIIDDGIIGTHEDFGDNLWINHTEIPENNIDDDGNGYIDDYLGWDTYNNNGNVYTDGSHGTPVTGIIGAQGNNSIGVTGVNWDVKLMIVRGGGNEANALASYAYPYYFRKLYNDTDGERGAFVVVTNASWGTDYGNPDDAPIWCNFYDELGKEGILSCGATANLGINIDVEGDLPTGCSSDFLISVTNMNRNDEKENNAGYGLQSIDLGAFGEGTYTTNGNNGYSEFGGTSGATPHVAGTVALLYSAPCVQFSNLVKDDPSLAAFLVKDYILNGVEPIESLDGITVTGGRLNINNSLLLSMANCSGCPIATNVEFGETDLDGVMVNWDQSAENDAMNLRYRNEFENEWTVINNVTRPYFISGVELCALYEVQLQSVCDTTSNIFLGDYTFQSEGCCEFGQDANLTIVADNIETIITIPEVLISEEYVLEYKSTLEEEWNIAFANENREVKLGALEFCTKYQFRVQLTCGGDISDYYNFLDYTTGCDACSDLSYCEIPFTNAGFEWIESVAFGQDTFVSGVGATGGYQSFIGTKTYTFRQEEYIDLELTPGFLGGSFDEFWKVWLDYDQDGIFNDQEELVYQSVGLSDSINVGQFKVPLNAPIGYIRMRIIMCYDGPTISCGDDNLEFGETEDYCVYIDERSGVSTPRLYNIAMYPNPTRNNIRLKNVFEPGEIQVFTATGQLMISKPVSGTGDYELSLVELENSGVYLVVFNSEKGIWSEKLIKI